MSHQYEAWEFIRDHSSLQKTINIAKRHLEKMKKAQSVAADIHL
ncbi:hypothetical protein [Chengkuizengella marina]|nr:hypothetical protein [Chengkuizengella marina]